MYEYRRACSSIARNAGPGCRCLRIQHMRSCSLDTIIQREIENEACELIYFRNMEGSRWLKKGPCPDSKHPTRYRKITSCTFRIHQQCSLCFPIRPLECWAQLDRRLWSPEISGRLNSEIPRHLRKSIRWNLALGQEEQKEGSSPLGVERLH